MRLSTSFIYSLHMQAILNKQSQVSHIGQQLATGDRIVNPSDDPMAAAQAIKISNAIAVNNQFADARTAAKRSLSLEASTLQNTTDVITAAKQLLVQAGNGTLSDDNRLAIAEQLEGLFEQLKSLANTTGSNGNYLFSGFESETRPVDDSGAIVVDAETRSLHVSRSREIAIQDSAKHIFKEFTANARYVGQAGDNSGSAIFENVNLGNASATRYGQSFQIEFGTAGSGTYQVRTMDSNGNVNSVSSGTYVAGQPIDLGNVGSVVISGSPDAGDKFTFRQSNADAVNFGSTDNMLETLATAVEALRGGTSQPHDKAVLKNALSTARVALDNHMNSVLSVQAEVGTRLNALENLQGVAANRDLAFDENLSRLEDVNVVSTITDYAQAKLALKFAQKAYQDINSLSLFSLRLG